MSESSIPTHRLYQRHCAEWVRYRKAHAGGEDYLAIALRKHEHERTANYHERLARAIYPNHVRAIVDTYAAHLYRDPISREVEGKAKETLEEFWANIDLMGTPADEFWEEVGQAVQTQGRAAIVTDRYDPGEATTLAQQKELGVRPYSYLIHSEDLINWDVDKRGELVAVMIREVRDTKQDLLSSSPDEPEYQYKLWTRDEWIIYVEETSDGEDGEKETKLVEQERDAHPVGAVPVTLVFWGKRAGREPLADSALKDLEPQNRRLVNLISYIDEQICQYVFSLLAAPRSTYDVLESVNFSVSGAIPYGDEVANPPHWIAPDVAQIAAIRAEIEKTEGALRQLSGLGRVNEETKHVSTGIALSYLTFDKDALLAKFAQRMSRAEASVDRHAAAWMGIAPDQVNARRNYPSSFDPQDLRDSLDAALKTVSLGITGKALYEVQAFALRELLSGHISGEKIKEVLDDLQARLEPGASQGA